MNRESQTATIALFIPAPTSNYLEDGKDYVAETPPALPSPEAEPAKAAQRERSISAPSHERAGAEANLNVGNGGCDRSIAC
jgi:hypothetical protein